MLLSNEVLGTLRRVFGDPNFLLRIQEDWSDGARIRLDVETYFKSNADLSRTKWDLIPSPPNVNPGHLSISHSPAGGAWSYSAKCSGLGVDVEDTHRIKTDTVARISKKAEILKCPQPSFLWTGKEAVFKSLWPDNEGVLISQIELTRWEPENQQLWLFYAALKGGPIEGLGAAFSVDDFAVSCFIRTS